MRDQNQPTEGRPQYASAVLPRAGDDRLVGRIIGGRLLIEARIGVGALGVVYRARHLHLDQLVAVKVMHGTFESNVTLREQFHAEARAASLLDHPNLVRVIDSGEESDGTLWLAMELLDGFDLQDLLADIARMPIERAAEIVMQVAGGLAHAHARGIVHGDVKPSNVVLVKHHDDDGLETERAKICDFGIARPLAESRAESGGTPAYMSPEQCLGEPLDQRSDVYACGILLYELVTGEPPFSGGDEQDILRQQLLVMPLAPSQRRFGIEPRLDAVVMKALSKDKEKRQGSMRELRNELRAVMVDLGHAVRPTLPPPLPFSSIPTPKPMARFTPLPTIPPDESGSFPVESEQRALRRRSAPDDHFAQFLAARPSRNGEVRALSDLLEQGTVDDVAARVARLLGRHEESLGRDAAAAEALALLDDSSRLAPLAERLLGDDVLASPYVERLVRRAGLAGARALWAARIAHRATHERRKRFVSWLVVVGPGARPVLLAALRRLATHATAETHPDLVEDVLLALPSGYDKDLAESVELFLVSKQPRIREQSVAALARVGF